MATWADVSRIANALPEVIDRADRDGRRDWHVYFTTPHFNGYPAVLVHLDHIPLTELEELIVEAWLIRAPKRLAAGFLASS